MPVTTQPAAAGWTINQQIEEVITRELAREGGWSEDAGGTNMGITIQSLAAYLGKDVRDVPLQELRDLKIETARTIYRKDFVDAPGFGRIFTGKLLDLVVDAGVQHSPARAIAWLQEILGFVPIGTPGARGRVIDGILGPITQAALTAKDKEDLYNEFLMFREELYIKLATKRPQDKEVFLGWMNRLAPFRTVVKKDLETSPNV